MHTNKWCRFRKGQSHTVAIGKVVVPFGVITPLPDANDNDNVNPKLGSPVKHARKSLTSVDLDGTHQFFAQRRFSGTKTMTNLVPGCGCESVRFTV